MTTDKSKSTNTPSNQTQTGLITTIVGFFIFTIGAKPEWYGLDRSPVVGFVQIAVFLIGLAIICVGGYIGINALWGNGERSITADIGLRLAATGYVLAFFTGMADLFGMGTQPLPMVPFFGPLQALGMEIGQGVILFGFLIAIPRKRRK